MYITILINDFIQMQASAEHLVIFIIWANINMFCVSKNWEYTTHQEYLSKVILNSPLYSAHIDCSSGGKHP